MIIFVVVGRLGKSLTISKVEPFVALKQVSKVYIFRQEPGFFIEKAEYVVLPGWLTSLQPSVFKKILRLIYEAFQLIKYTRKLKPDLINGVFTLPKGLNSVIAGKITGTSTVVSVVGGIVEITTRFNFKWFWENFNLRMLKMCTAVTTKGNAVSGYLISKGIHKEKIFTLNGSIDTKKFVYNANVEKDIDVLFVGRFSNLKGPDRVLHVIQKLKDTLPNIKAVLIGEGELSFKVTNLIKEYNLEEQVEVPGYIEHPEKWFQRSKCILIPSESEGLPTCMLEAMACGCIPIVSDVGNVKEAAVHQVNSMVVSDYTDIETFSNYTKMLLTNTSLRMKMIPKAIAKIADSYSINKQAEIANEIIAFCQMNK
jgi:glycosyltransferase involved in cell wall biosynthesis